MKNPLNRRFLRELRDDFSRYLVIFLLLVFTISFCSGFFVADGSMIKAYNDSFEDYNIEDGHFAVAKTMNRAQRKAVEALGIRVYDNYYTDQPLTCESTLRVFSRREVVNRACVMDGVEPVAADEIAIDRMFADNNHLSVGDTITFTDDAAAFAGKTFRITALVALSDYSCLYQDNNDSMFDAVKFGVSYVTPEGFSACPKDALTFSYAWKYVQPPAGEAEEKTVSDDLMEKMSREVSLTTFVPRYLNHAITFTGEDMGGDRAMMMALLYIITAIIAFVFGITINSTIQKEATVIGALRATGYTRSELIRHFMVMPLAVTVIAALVGNVLGYTVLKDVCAGMYYGSYSLPTYVTIWSAEAFVLTTIVPFVLMMLITYTILRVKLSLPPLKFLRKDLTRRRHRKAFRLSPRLPFFLRFRLRVILQNAGNYFVLFVGILFANLLLMFGLLFPDALQYYSENLSSNLIANNQYILQLPLGLADESRHLENAMKLLMISRELETENPDAEKFSAYSLKTLPESGNTEDILLYGVQPDSRYVNARFGPDDIYISSSFADKYELQVGEELQLKEAYEATRYTFLITGIYDYEGTLCVFMDKEALNERFDLGKDAFAGYFSDTPITDIDEKYMGTTIDLESLTKISRQLDVSMGSMMGLVDAFAAAIFMILIYLLSKIIIEKNASAISMTKILGYNDREISRLYVHSTTVMVVIFLLLSLPFETALMRLLFRLIMVGRISGWIPVVFRTRVYVKMLALGIATYAVVSVLEYRRIKKVPMDVALKNGQE